MLVSAWPDTKNSGHGDHFPSGRMQALPVTTAEEAAPGPGQVAQCVGASSHTPKGCRFDSQSGHLQEATDECFFLTSMFLSTSSSLHFSLSKINKNKSSSENFSKIFKRKK